MPESLGTGSVRSVPLGLAVSGTSAEPMVDLPGLDTWIGGAPESSALEEHSQLHDPNTGIAVCQSFSSSPSQVDRALAAADAAHRRGDLQRLGVEGRAERLEAFATAIDGAADQIALLEALGTGVPLSMTRLFARGLSSTIRKAIRLVRERGDRRILPAAHLVELRFVPWGPTALILPWNAPAFLATKKLAFALAAGAPAVVKPSPVSPWSVQWVMRAAAASGFPEGTVNLLMGGKDVGGALCSDRRVRAISMTGSTATGRHIAQTAAARFARLRLELGSNNPAVVLADASVPETAEQLFRGMTKLNGQWCEAPRNVFVPRHLLADLVDALTQHISAAVIGSSLRETTTIGPLALRERQQQLSKQLDTWRHAGHRVVDTDVPDLGWFFSPTLVVGQKITVTAEVFGPMLTIEPVDSEAEAIGQANSCAGGLAGYVFGRNVEAATRVGRCLTAGEIKINGTSILDMSPESAQSFFGSSGIGGHGDRDVLDFYVGKQVIGSDPPDTPI
jgi:betaine-aldehyde dehydrogenase